MDLLDRADEENLSLRGYVDRYHEKDKEAAVLTEKLNRDRAVDIFFGTGVGLGGVIAALGPYLWEKIKTDTIPGTIALIVGLALILGASIGRWVKR